MSHSPKQRALEAYAAERLSPLGALRLERHLSACAHCNETLHQVRAYTQLREDAAAFQPPTLSWERLEAALDAAPAQAQPGVVDSSLARPAAPDDDRAKRAQRPATKLHSRARGRASTGRWIALAWPVLAVAATAAIAWMGLRGSPEQAERPSEPVRVAELGSPSVGRVTLVAGEVWLEQDSAKRPVDLATEVPEGARLVTAQDAAVHVLLADGTGFALGSESSLWLRELRKDGIQLELERGSLANQVHKLTSSQHYVVTLGALSARVRGTRFVVEQRPGAAPSARVFVHEGLVEVARDGEVLALLGPGQGYESPTPATPGAAARERSVHGIGATPTQLADAWGTLSLPPMAELHAWIIDAERVAPQGGLRMRLPRGSTQLSFEDARGHIRSIALDLSERETQLEPGALAKLVAPKELRVGRLEPEQITRVIRAGIEPLRRCYERGLRVMPKLAGKLTLSVRVGADGRVQRAEPQSAELPREIARCISQEATRLVFPKPQGGGPVSFDVPLNLKSR